MHAANGGWWRKWLAGAVLLLCAWPAGIAQNAVPTSALVQELSSLSDHAAAIFVGQIVSVERHNSVVEIAFRVEQPVRGAVGKTVVLREWAGAWGPGSSRYTVGARALAFLHGSSAAGFSTPVHGAEGLVPVVVQGADRPQLLDVRRLAASVVRAPGTPLPSGPDAALELTDALQVIAGRPFGAEMPARLPLPERGRPPVDLLSASAPNAALNKRGRGTLFTSAPPEISNAHR